MEVLVGPTFTIDVPSSPPPTGQTDGRLFLNGVSGCPEEQVPAAFRISGPSKFFAGGSSEPESSSSIGTPDDSDNEEEEVQSELNLKGRNGLGSLDSLEDSLPIKSPTVKRCCSCTRCRRSRASVFDPTRCRRGLSSHFDGKSKSFTDLSQVSSLTEMKKQESPFNKRRRVLIASKFPRRSAFYSWSNPQSMPLLPVDEDRHDDDYEDYEEGEEEKARKVPSALSSSSSSSFLEDKKQDCRVPESYAAEMRLRLRSFKSRSFSLADLQEHDDEEDDNDD